MANEGRNAVEFVDATLAQCREFRTRTFLAVIDRASKDDTLQLVSEHAKTTPDLKVIWAPENRGVVDAYVRGYREALALNPDWILEIDAGFSHQPEDIPVLFAKMREGYDCVFGSRFCEGGSISDSSKKRYWISWGGTVLTNLLRHETARHDQRISAFHPGGAPKHHRPRHPVTGPVFPDRDQDVRAADEHRGGANSLSRGQSQCRR